LIDYDTPFDGYLNGIACLFALLILSPFSPFSVTALFASIFSSVDDPFSENWTLSLQIFNQLESESYSFFQGQRDGSEPDQVFMLTAFLHTSRRK
jgi:hypothetical protein